MINIVCISGLRLEKAELELDITRITPELETVCYVTALPGGEAVFDNFMRIKETHQVLKVDSQGQVKQVIYTCVECPSAITGLIVLGEHLYVIHSNGTVVETRVSDGRVVRRATIPDVEVLINRGSLYSNPDKIHKGAEICCWVSEEDLTGKFDHCHPGVRAIVREPSGPPPWVRPSWSYGRGGKNKGAEICHWVSEQDLTG